MLYENKKDFKDVLNLIKNKLNIKEINLDSSEYQKDIEKTKINCLYAECNRDKIKYEDLTILAYEIIQDELSFKYYKKYIEEKMFYRPIYIMIETNTGYLCCNNKTLFKELILYQGISQYDIENNTGELSLYLRLIDE